MSKKKHTELKPASATTKDPVVDEDAILKKFAGAVHIGADLTLWQRRAFNVLLYAAMDNMPHTTRHEIELDMLAWGMAVDRTSQRYGRVIDSISKMMEARVTWNLLDENGELEEWESATLLPYVKVNTKTRRVIYEFTRAFQDRVYRPAEFAEIALRLQRVFRSEHTLALYENTRRFLDQGETPWIPIPIFRALMGVDGKPYYDEYKYLNARLIKPAVSQINETSDIRVELKARRRARAVTDIKFLVCANPQMTLFAESLVQPMEGPSAEGQRRLLLQLAGYRITGKRAQDLIEAYPEEQILEAIEAAHEWMERKESKGEAITNPGGVIYKAVTENWKRSDEAGAAIEGVASRVESKQASPDGDAKESDPARSVRRDVERADARRQWYESHIRNMPSEEIAQWTMRFESWLQESGNKLVLERFRAEGLRGMTMGMFHHFLAENGIVPPEGGAVP